MIPCYDCKLRNICIKDSWKCKDLIKYSGDRSFNTSDLSSMERVLKKIQDVNELKKICNVGFLNGRVIKINPCDRCWERDEECENDPTICHGYNMWVKNHIKWKITDLSVYTNKEIQIND